MSRVLSRRAHISTAKRSSSPVRPQPQAERLVAIRDLRGGGFGFALTGLEARHAAAAATATALTAVAVVVAAEHVGDLRLQQLLEYLASRQLDER